MTQAQAQPVKPGFDGVQVATQLGEATFERAGVEEDFEKLRRWCAKYPDTSFCKPGWEKELRKVLRWCSQHPKACEEKTKKTSFWEKARAYARCASRIVVFVGTNYFAISKLKKSGGVWKVAKRTWEAPGKEAKIRVLVVAIGEYVGIEEVAQGCGL